MSRDEVGLRYVSEGHENAIRNINSYTAATQRMGDLNKKVASEKAMTRFLRENSIALNILRGQMAATAGPVSRLGDRLDSTGTRIDRATTLTDRLRQRFLATANTIAVLDGPLGGIASRFSSFGVLLGRVGVILAATSVAITGLGVAFTRATRNLTTTETALLSIDGALRLSGNAAGFTSNQLNNLSLRLEALTLTDRDAARGAITQLLTFQNVTGQVFERTLWLSQDFAQIFGGTMESVSVRLARALSDPINSLSLLERSFGKIEPQIRRSIIAFAEQGDLLQAQELILQAYENRIGGIGREAAGGLAGAFDSLSGSLRSLSEAFGEAVAAMTIVRVIVNSLTATFNFLAEDESMGRIVAILQVAATYFGVRLVASLVLARVAVTGLTVSFTALRAIMMRFLPTAIFVLLGELVYRFTTIVRALGGLGEAFSAVSSVAVEVFQRIMEVSRGMYNLFKGVATGIASAFVGAFATIFEQWDALINAMIGPFNALMEATGSSIRIAQARLGASLRSVSDDLRDTSVAAIKLGADLIKGATAPLESIKELRALLEEDAEETLVPKVPTLEPTDSSGGRGSRGSREQIKNLDEVLSRLAEEQRRRLELLNLGEQERAQRELYYKIVDEIGEVEAIRHDALIQQFITEYSERERLIEQLERQEEISKQLEQSFESAFVGFVTGANRAKEAAGQLLQQLSRLLAQQAFQSLFGGAFSGGGGFLSGLFGGFRADGGPVSAGRSYIVGERGPELFTPGASGQITSNENMRGGGQLVIRLDLSQDVEARIMQNTSAQSVQIVRTETPQMIRGAFSQARERRAFD